MAILVPFFLQSIWDANVRCWSFIRTWVSNHHFSVFCLFAWAVIRVSVSIVSTIFNTIFTVATTSQSLVQTTNSMSGASALTYFGVVNAFFPVVETFTFLGAVLSLRGALWAYVFYRAVYKSIPLKST